MASLSSIQRATQVARVNCARVGASRVGFTPTATKVNSITAVHVGGPRYAWERVYLPTTTWTVVQR